MNTAVQEVVNQLRDRIEQLKGEREQLVDALDHIMRTCAGSRTQTRRLRWIAVRCRSAIDGNDDWKSVDVPVNDPMIEQLRELIARIFPIAKAELSQLVSGYTTPADQRAGLTAEALIETIDENGVHEDAVVLRKFLLDARRIVPQLNIAELNKGEPWVQL